LGLTTKAWISRLNHKTKISQQPVVSAWFICLQYHFTWFYWITLGEEIKLQVNEECMLFDQLSSYYQEKILMSQNNYILLIPLIVFNFLPFALAVQFRPQSVGKRSEIKPFQYYYDH
jgi:hypothetical protein